MDWQEIKTNDKMNDTTNGLLVLRGDSVSLYARKRIEELELLVARLDAKEKMEERFRNFIRTNHLTAKWDTFLTENENNKY